MTFRSRLTLAVGLLLLARPLPAQEWKVPAWAHLIPVDQIKLPGPANTEVLGYPPVTVDKLAIRRLLLAGQFDELDRTLATLQDSTRARIQREYDLASAYETFETADSLLGPPLARWSATLPGSAHARAALATWHLARAWNARGQGLASTVSGSSWEVVKNEVAASLAAASEALAIDSASYGAWCATIRAHLLTGAGTAATAAFNAGYARFPASYNLTRIYLVRLWPRWGGSHEAMNAFIAQILPDTLENPRLRTLQGAVEGEIANDLADEDARTALRHANAALQYGPEFSYLVERGHAFLNTGNYARAIVDLDAALGQRYQDDVGILYHAQAVSGSSAWETGGIREIVLQQEKRDYQTVLAFDPTSATALSELASVTIELTKCPEFKPECGGEENGTEYVVRKTFGDLNWWLGYIGVGGFLGYWTVIRWARSGYKLPFYIHIIALGGFLTIAYAQYLWVQTGAPMTLRRWIVTFTVPLLVYVLFVGLGGAGAAARRRSQ